MIRPKADDARRAFQRLDSKEKGRPEGDPYNHRIGENTPRYAMWELARGRETVLAFSTKSGKSRLMKDRQLEKVGDVALGADAIFHRTAISTAEQNDKKLAWGGGKQDAAWLTRVKKTEGFSKRKRGRTAKSGDYGG